MQPDKKEILLWALAAFLCVAVAVTAMVSAPAFDPVTVVYSSAPMEEDVSTRPPPAQGERVDLNIAGKAELMTLDGIGEKLAERIIAYRETHGGFASVEELLNVEGIGETRLEAIRDQVTVD